MKKLGMKTVICLMLLESKEGRANIELKRQRLI
jgi:hypothetical protein